MRTANIHSKHVLSDQGGALLVEVSIMLPLIFVLVLGSVDFLFLFFQWNRAAKAVQIGARLAAVSNPVAVGLTNLSQAVAGDSGYVGGPMPNFLVTCNGRSKTCTCQPASGCRGVSGYDAPAMDAIVFGRGSSSCSDAKSVEAMGMCDIFQRITPANVV